MVNVYEVTLGEYILNIHTSWDMTLIYIYIFLKILHQTLFMNICFIQWMEATIKINVLIRLLKKLYALKYGGSLIILINKQK